MDNQISVESMSVIRHANVAVITTELLAHLYGADIKNVQNNYARNADRFVAGKHYFKISGKELADLRVSLSHPQNLQPSLRGLQISTKTRSLILWTERGAARHAKMLETDQAWEVFEKLEDCYFSQKSNTHQQKPPKVADASVNAADLLFKLNLICSTWEAARAEIAMFDPKIADHLNKTMNMFWMYTVSMKGIVGRKVTPQLSR